MMPRRHGEVPAAAVCMVVPANHQALRSQPCDTGRPAARDACAHKEAPASHLDPCSTVHADWPPAWPLLAPHMANLCNLCWHLT
jgi:hypothetical protein